MDPLASILALGFLLGLKHALDADHVVAVSTIVTRSRNLWNASLIGAAWGFGHTFTLLAVGLPVLALRLEIPEPLALSAEFLVGLVLIGLGVSTLWEHGRRRIHTHLHHHGKEAHHHFHSHEESADHAHPHWSHQLRRPFAVGMVHGLAGSGALAVLVMSTLPSVAGGLLYIALFGLGSVGGMLLLSTAIGLPFAVTLQRFEPLSRVLALGAGAASILVGVLLAWEIGVGSGLFTGRPLG